MSSLVAKWAPPNERATMMGFCNSGMVVQTCINNLFDTLIIN